MNKSTIWRAVVIVTLAGILVAGCTPVRPQFVDDGRELSADQALDLPIDLNPGALAGRPTADAEQLRSKALASMRREGGTQADVASLITAGLPTSGRGVPFYVELAEVDSVPAIVVVEATGPKTGILEDQRVWVLDRTGKVILMGTR